MLGAQLDQNTVESLMACLEGWLAKCIKDGYLLQIFNRS